MNVSAAKRRMAGRVKLFRVGTVAGAPVSVCHVGDGAVH
jgi:hypothetical protein